MLPSVASTHILFFIFVHSHLPTCANSNVTSRPKLHLYSTEAHIDFQLFKISHASMRWKNLGPLHQQLENYRSKVPILDYALAIKKDSL